MGLLKLAAATLAIFQAVQAVPTPEADEVLETSAAGKYCDAATTICYSEYKTGDITYRIAISDKATAAPFDVLLSIIAPKATGWAAIAWGGVMANNPLTVAWASGDKTVVSSRWAAGHTLPTVYASANYTVLPGSVVNATHWTLNVLAKGVSSWTNGKLDPASTATNLAYGSSINPPTTPADPASRFGIHQSKGKWSHDLNGSKIANFDALVQKAAGAA
ncbi:CBD9-like protein [Thozetella sp. PMI_491]|nr:CBD9-like protein [Thozetella sp. PMI_491]